jgi:hypothetical protein
MIGWINTSLQLRNLEPGNLQIRKSSPQEIRLDQNSGGDNDWPFPGENGVAGVGWPLLK